MENEFLTILLLFVQLIFPSLKNDLMHEWGKNFTDVLLNFNLNPLHFIVSGISSPICVISSAKYLAASGWVELKNKSDTYEPPFRLYRDEGRNYLQVSSAERMN